METYFRAQHKGHSFEDMLSFVSVDGGDGLANDVGGLCACSSVNELLHNTVMSAMDSDDEVVVFLGYELAEIYDGYRVRPVRELRRYTVTEVKARRGEIEGEIEDDF